MSTIRNALSTRRTARRAARKVVLLAGLAVNPCTGTIYIANQYLPGSISILRARSHPAAPPQG